MSLKIIHTVRHGFRSTWTTDPETGVVTHNAGLNIKNSATGIPTDVYLSAHGVNQARELGAYIASLPENERPQVIYSSPWHRCLQTSQPIYETLRQQQGDTKIHVRTNPGIGEWFAPGPFTHPQKLTSTEQEQVQFKGMIDTRTSYEYSGRQLADVKPWVAAVPRPYVKSEHQELKGETIAMLHDRVANTLRQIIEECDSNGVERILITSHAATLIAIGRVLSGFHAVTADVDQGYIPDDNSTDWTAPDFETNTCGLSTFKRDLETPLPNIEPYKTDESEFGGGRNPLWWQGGACAGKWKVLRNSETSFLANGAERSWHFGEP